MRVRFKLYLITDRKLAVQHGGLLPICAAALRAANETAGEGAIAIQLREKDLSACELYALGREMRELCTRFHAPLMVSDRIDVAIACGADGVHLPADSFAVADARRLLGPSRLIGVSTHEHREVRAAAADGADFAVFGPVYAPLSKENYSAPQGIAALRAACDAAGCMPVFALGGITAERAREIAADGLAGIGVIGAVFGADDPALAVKALLKALSAKR